jgi:hypothetical protein
MTVSPPPPRARNLFENGERSVEENAAIRLSVWFWACIGGIAIWGTFSPNPLLTPVAISVLAACVQLLWRRGEPPVLVFACAMQWLQAAAVIFYTDFYGVSLQAASGSVEFETATWLSLIAVFVLALGMRLALVRGKGSQHAALTAEASRVNISNAFIAYLITFVVAIIAERIAFAIPPVTQAIYALVTFKWMAVFILAYCIIEQRVGYFFLAIVVVLEVGVGLLAYFASFKSVFFVLLVVALTSPLALRGRRLVITVSVALALFFMGVVWSAIKVEYREFLNQGTEQQEIDVTAQESAVKLVDLIGNFTWDNFTDGLDTMIVRVGYTKYFALTLMNVPSSVPYENGALWLGTLKHIVTPRLFFPEKGAISDSERTTLYTGELTAGEESGTSIGIGYVAESYVDFGPVWMFAPIFLLGVFYGLIYRFFIIRSRSKLICAALASSILIFGAYEIETSNIKIVGGNVTVLLVVIVFYFIFGRAFRAWLELRPGR